MDNINNIHIRISRLEKYAGDELAKLEAYVGESVELGELGIEKNAIDSTTKILVRTKSNHPVAVIICSRGVSPEFVANGVKVAEQIHTVTGKQLGKVIIRPLYQGYADKLSFAIFPYCLEFSSFRPIRIYQRVRVRKHLLQWLVDVTTNAVGAINVEKDTSQSFNTMLRYLYEQHFVDNDVRQAIKFALERIERGVWQPQHTIDHNDLWDGNIMLPAHCKEDGRLQYPFVLIDWYGANPCGYGIFDLVRIALSFNFSDRVLQRELISHSIALKCDLVDTRGHLLAALARLHQHLQCFPETRYLVLFKACWQKFNRALSLK